MDNQFYKGGSFLPASHGRLPWTNLELATFLVHHQRFLGILAYFRDFGGIFVILGFLGIFLNFRDLGGTLVILEILGFFWLFGVYFSHLVVSRVFWSF